MGRLTPRAPCSALTTISFFLFFPVLFCSFVLFFLTRAADYAEKEGLLVMYRSRVFFGLVTQLTLCAGGGGGMMKPRIDLRMSKTIDMCGT